MSDSLCLAYVCRVADLSNGTLKCYNVPEYCGAMAAAGRLDYDVCVRQFSQGSLRGPLLSLDQEDNCFQTMEACVAVCGGANTPQPTDTYSQPATLDLTSYSAATRSRIQKNLKRPTINYGNRTGTVRYSESTRSRIQKNLNRKTNESYRYSQPAVDKSVFALNPNRPSESIAAKKAQQAQKDNNIAIGNYSTTKSTSNSRNAFIESSKKTIIDKTRINIGKAMREGGINTLTGKFKEDFYPTIDNQIIAFDNNKNPTVNSISFTKIPKPTSINIQNNSQIAIDQNFDNLQSTWDWFNGNGEDYLLPPAPYYDTCRTTTWICIKDL